MSWNRVLRLSMPQNCICLLLYITRIWTFDVLKTKDKKSPNYSFIKFNETKRRIDDSSNFCFVISLLDPQASHSFFKTSLSKSGDALFPKSEIIGDNSYNKVK